MKIQECAENYLEAILVLTQKNGQVRSIDVAHYTGFSKPSISRAVGLLRDNGYVSIDQNGLLGLTESGMQIATSIYERHTVLTAFLTALGVDAETAAADACRIAHVLSEETFEAGFFISNFIDQIFDKIIAFKSAPCYNGCIESEYTAAPRLAYL